MESKEVQNQFEKCMEKDHLKDKECLGLRKKLMILYYSVKTIYKSETKDLFKKDHEKE